MVRTDPHGTPELFAPPHQRQETFGHAGQLVCVLGLAVLANFEAFLVGVVSRG